MHSESDLLPISALQHFIFCERQWALTHLEQVWLENRLTTEGKQLHERVDEPEHETRGGVRAVRALPLRSLQLGITGRADVVEFHPDGTILPVEYKRGKPKKERCDEVQLCAQALCLEEMTGHTINVGALFYGQPRRRHEVTLDDTLRRFTQDTIARMHAAYQARTTPMAVYENKCDNCSLLPLCMPKTTGRQRSAAAWVKSQVARSLAADQNSASSYLTDSGSKTDWRENDTNL